MTNITIAVGQFGGTPDWRENLATCLDLVASARDNGVDLLVLPEGAFRTREGQDPDPGENQTLDGPFVDGLRVATSGTGVTVVVGTLERTSDPRVSNTLVALSGGHIVSVYRKIHLYDAFSDKESDRIQPGDGPLEVFDVKGFAVGMMTCYDVRFPEVARSLAVQGADILALPAAWVGGPLKESHWHVMTRARALENTCFVAAAGKSGRNRIGMSCVIDPLGVVRAQLGHDEGMATVTVSREELDRVRARLPLLAQRRMPSDLQPAARPLSATESLNRDEGQAAEILDRSPTVEPNLETAARSQQRGTDEWP